MKFAFIRLFMAEPIFLLLINICDKRMRESLCSMSKNAFFGGKKKQRKEQKGDRKKDRDTQTDRQYQHKILNQTNRQIDRQRHGQTDKHI